MAYNFFDILDAAADHDPETDNLVNYYPNDVITAAACVSMTIGHSRYERQLFRLHRHYLFMLENGYVWANNVPFWKLEFVRPNVVVDVVLEYVLDRIGITRIDVRRAPNYRDGTDFYFELGSYDVAQQLIAAEDTLADFFEDKSKAEAVAADLLRSWFWYFAYKIPPKGVYRHGEKLFEAGMGGYIGYIYNISGIAFLGVSDPILDWLFRRYPRIGLELVDGGVRILRTDCELLKAPPDRPISMKGDLQLIDDLLRYNAKTISRIKRGTKLALLLFAWNAVRVVDPVDGWDLPGFKALIEALHKRNASFDIGTVILSYKLGGSWRDLATGNDKANVYSGLYKIV